MDMEVSVPASGFGEDGMSVASVEVVAGLKASYSSLFFSIALELTCDLSSAGRSSASATDGYRVD